MEIEEMLHEIEETLKGYILRVGPLAGKLPDGRSILDFMADELRNHTAYYDGEACFCDSLEKGVSYMHCHVTDEVWLNGFFFDR